MKKTNLLMPILGVGALAGTIVPYAVSCGTNTPDDPTEAPEMIITKSADTVLSDGQITITVDSTTKGKVEITSVKLDDDDFSATISGNKIIVTTTFAGHLFWPAICIASIDANCDGKQMERQNVTIIGSSDANYELLTSTGYVDEINTIYTQKSKEIIQGETRYLAIEYNLSKFKNDENFNNANNCIYFTLPKNTSWEIGEEGTHAAEHFTIHTNDRGLIDLPSACEAIQPDNFQFYYINPETIKEAEHELSLNDTIYLFVKIKNNGTGTGSISTMYV